jgi:hypothetical protein
MKTNIQSTVGKLLLSAATLGLTTLFLFNGTAHAQHSAFVEPEANTASVPGKFQASVFPSLNPLLLKVVFKNPAKEAVKLIVRKDDKEIVYKKVIGNTEYYSSKFDISNLPDGDYTFEIKGKTSSFSHNVYISAQTARLINVH